MSSEGSVASSSSRIRQFGLYRTIDVKTDEFLRTSRKRQITQGCACAAISTAITVTVVVSVILVYEYSINVDTNENKKISLRPKWLGLLNESDSSILDAKDIRGLNLDRSSLKLLPILLKAINENRYLEKVIHDYTSSSPPSVKNDNTENYVKRNIFSDAKNWLKMPPQKIYALDYKTTPFIYIKRPSQHLEYLSKIRKMKNYERMLNYFDKMINEKVTYSKPTNAEKLDYGYTENTFKAVTKPKRLKGTKKNKHKSNTQVKKSNETKHRTPIVIKHINSNKENGSCQCPKDMGQLLSKLIESLKDIVPHTTSQMSPCAKELKSRLNVQDKLVTKSVKPVTTTLKLSTLPTIKQVVTKPTTTTTSATTTTIQRLKLLPTTTDITTESTMKRLKMEGTTKVINTESTTVDMNLGPMIFNMQTKFLDDKINTERMAMKISTNSIKNQIKTESTTNAVQTEPITPKVHTELTVNEIITEPTTPEIITKINKINTVTTNTEMETKPMTFEIQLESTTNKIESAPVTVESKISLTTNMMKSNPTIAIITRTDSNSTPQETTELTEIPLVHMAKYISGTKNKLNIPKIGSLNNMTNAFDTPDSIKLTTTTEEQYPYFEYTTSSSLGKSSPIPFIEPMPMYEIYDTLPANPENSTPIIQTAPPTVATTTKIATTTKLTPKRLKFENVEEPSPNENFLDTVAEFPQYAHPIVPVYKDDDYDYYVPTPKERNAFEDFDRPSNSLVKEKMVEKVDNNNKFKNNMRKVGYKTKLSNYHPFIKNRQVDYNNMRKMADLVYRQKKIIDDNSTPVYKENRSRSIVETNTSLNNNIEKNKFISLVKNNIAPKVVTVPTDTDLNQDNLNTSPYLARNVEVEDEDEWTKQPENRDVPSQYNNSNTFINNNKSSIPQSDANKRKSEDKIIFNPIESMSPSKRPGYLEVRLNDAWKPDDQTDYDNMNIFD